MEYNNRYFDELASLDEIPEPITSDWLRALGVYIRTARHKNPIIEEYLYLRLFYEAEALREYELTKAESEHKKAGTLTPLNPLMRHIQAVEVVYKIYELMKDNNYLNYTQARAQVAEDYGYSDSVLKRLINNDLDAKKLAKSVNKKIKSER